MSRAAGGANGFRGSIDEGKAGQVRRGKKSRILGDF